MSSNCSLPYRALYFTESCGASFHRAPSASSFCFPIGQHQSRSHSVLFMSRLFEVLPSQVKQVPIISRCHTVQTYDWDLASGKKIYCLAGIQFTTFLHPISMQFTTFLHPISMQRGGAFSSTALERRAVCVLLYTNIFTAKHVTRASSSFNMKSQLSPTDHPWSARETK